MKKTIFVAALAFSFAFVGCKEDASKKVNDENVATAANRDQEAGKYPVMTFEKVEHDFGVIDQGTAVEHRFTFTNTGDAPLIIVDAKSSCGCTVPEKPKDPIAPGDTGELLVKFNGSGKNQVTKTVNITTNTEKGRETLRIKAFVNPKEGSNGTPVQSK